MIVAGPQKTGRGVLDNLAGVGAQINYRRTRYGI